MAKYEVFIPAALASEFNVTLKVDADNWTAALKSGLKRLGEHGTQVVNVMVDVMDDNSIHVTDTSSGRVFRIKELQAVVAPTAEPIPLTAPGAAPIPLSASAAAPVPLTTPAPIPLSTPAAATQRAKPVSKPPPESPRVTKPEKIFAEPMPLSSKPAESPRARRDESLARRVEEVSKPSEAVSGPIGRTKEELQAEDVLSELFERTQEAFGRKKEEGLYFLLDLALEKIQTDAGSIFVSDLATSNLQLASARGPKANELLKMKLRLPVGVGVVGFCVQEAVGLAISDTQKDPRFFRNVSEKIGYPTQSILCAPMISGGRTFGCIEILNRKGSSHFTSAELAILSYIAHQAAKYLEQM
jgi:hypothetical protein